MISKKEDKIFDIVTDLLREDISKEEAIDKLLILHSVVVPKGTFYCLDEITDHKKCTNQCKDCGLLD